MQLLRLSQIAIVASAIAVAAVACNRTSQAPETQTTTGVEPHNVQGHVIGCVKRGVADNSFVLMATQQSTTDATTTYQLNATSGTNLSEYVGQIVEVTGTLRSEQEITSSSGPTPAESAKGTTGTPTVETKTELDIKQFDVDSVRPQGAKCSD